MFLVVDLSFISKRETSVEEVNSVLKQASEVALKGVLGYNELPLVSIDFNHDSRPSVFDATQTRVSGNLVMRCLGTIMNGASHAKC